MIKKSAVAVISFDITVSYKCMDCYWPINAKRKKIKEFKHIYDNLTYYL